MRSVLFQRSVLKSNSALDMSDMSSFPSFSTDLQLSDIAEIFQFQNL